MDVNAWLNGEKLCSNPLSKELSGVDDISAHMLLRRSVKDGDDDDDVPPKMMTIMKIMWIMMITVVSI